jgi:hypothetical protein
VEQKATKTECEKRETKGSREKRNTRGTRIYIYNQRARDTSYWHIFWPSSKNSQPEKVHPKICNTKMTCEQKTMTASVNASERCGLFCRMDCSKSRGEVHKSERHPTLSKAWYRPWWLAYGSSCLAFSSSHLPVSCYVVAAPRKCPPSYKGREKKNFLGWVNERKMLPCEWSGYFGPLER